MPSGRSKERRNFADWLSDLPPQYAGKSVVSIVPPVLSDGNVMIAFQPIVSLKNERVFAFEALVRSDSSHYVNPIKLIDEAVQTRLTGKLGRFIREQSIENCPDFNLFMNIHPDELADAWLVRPDDPVFRHSHRTFVEITESAPFSHHDVCASVVRELRARNVDIVVDDFGAGFSNLSYIADLEPKVVKFDRGLIDKLSKNKRRQQTIRALATLCRELGALTVAEGIETAEDASASLDCGVDLGQGYLFARPDFAPKAFDKWKTGQAADY